MIPKETTIESTTSVKAKFNHTSKITLTAILTSLGIALRIFKHIIIGPIQIVNLPAVVTLIGAFILGATSAAFIGLTTFILSDFLLAYAGPWTAVTSICMATTGLLAGIVLKGKKFEDNINKMQLFLYITLLLFINDVASSFGGYLVLGFSPEIALVTSLIGLFIPAGGGFLFGIGPITEFSTAALVIFSIPLIRKALSEV
ncbi:MAG: hypothetical protein ACTSSJ_03765 [Candidatus Odinarchaeia archaeon]